MLGVKTLLGNIKGEPGKGSLTEDNKSEIATMVINILNENPMSSIVDENNNIILSGNLADGTYSVNYKNVDGMTVHVGNLVLDTNIYYTITNNLTQCTNSNATTQIINSQSYFAMISANSDYELSSIKVTMGGVDISSSVVNGNEISISNVTGNIVITAVAEEIQVTYTNLATKLSVGYRYSASNGSGQTLIETAGACTCEDFIPFVPDTVVRVKGLGDLKTHNTMFYKPDKTLYTNGKPNNMSEYCGYTYDATKDIVTLTPCNTTIEWVRFSGILSGTTANVTITVDEHVTKNDSVYYAVTNNLTNCSSSSKTSYVLGGTEYSVEITANAGYTLKSIIAYMGGLSQNTTASGNINIAEVTGDIEITAVAEKAQVTYTNLAQPLEVGRIRSAGTIDSSVTAARATAPIPFSQGDIIRVSGLDLSTYNLGIYNDDTATTVNTLGVSNIKNFSMLPYTLTENIYTITVESNSHLNKAKTIRFSGTLMSGFAEEDVVVTVNEPI